ncbi:MAG: hypothetical protein LBT79_04980, partial [Elusimicrobiota bacterium]|nr:hypothetical protein [Elusimicrobiota bacterium]
MFKIFKILFIILCVFIFAAKMDAVSVSNWTDFKSVYESTTAASDIDLSGDISFGSDLLPLGHNIEINGNSYYMLGTSFFAGSFNGFSLNSKSMILKDIMLLGFHRYYLGAAIDALDSSIAFQNQIKFSDNLYIDKQNSYLSSMEYRGIISARKSTFSFVDNSSLFKDNVRIEYERNTAFIPITISIYGGAIYSASSIISFDRSTITFADNFYLNFSSNIIKGKTKVEAFGGAFYAKQSSVSFMSSSITFAGNGSFLITQSATSHSYEEPSSSPMPFKSMPPPEPDGDFAFYFYGGALYTSLSTMNINESKISFLSNNAYTEGGALYTQNSIINIAQSSIDFNYNSAITRNGGGAAFIESLLTFENSSISFKNNYAGVFGGALYTLLSSVSFDNVNLYFNANKSNYGGALFFNESQISFYNSTASFNNNIAEYGGAISFYESKANFTDASFSFTSNTAFGNGGAFYAEENSIIEFSSMNIVFSFNVLSPKIEIVSKGTYTIESVFPAMSGGAAYLYLSSMIFNNTNALFNENKSNWNGGAIYANNYSIIEFNNSTISFTNNISSQSGGAIALLKSKLIFRASSINFLSNTAKEKGAALYADNSTIIFESSPTVLTFDSNISSSNADDIYLTNNSSFIIKSQNLNMSAKIYADNKSAIESYVSSITISSLTIKNKSAFIMTAQNVQRASFTYLDIDGIISLRLSSSSFISAAQIYLGENSELELFLNDESLKHLTIKIIEVSNSSYAINRFANERDIIIDTP